MNPVSLISSDEDDAPIAIRKGAGSSSKKIGESQSTKRLTKKVKLEAASSNLTPAPEETRFSGPGNGLTPEELARSQISLIDKELKYLDGKIDKLLQMRDQKQLEKALLEKSLGIGFGQTADSVDENNSLALEKFSEPEGFPWSKAIKDKLKQVWKVKDFRYIQLPVINATLSKRDAMVIMPTDSCVDDGKEKPSAITLVITPLVSLIKDQLFDLKRLGIPAAGLFGASSKEDRKAITAILKSTGNVEEAWKGLGLGAPPRLLYVTPEQVAQSKRFLSCMEKAYRDGRLARFVIDECHCCSQAGHDFRPDYKAAFPQVPILALTATCSPSVMNSVLSILGLERSSGLRKCLVFKSPLSRDNLSYSVMQKPAQAKDVIDKIIDFISARYKGQTGIIYCLSRKDTETVADSINEMSRGTIPTRAYHAYLDEDEKQAIHTAWRSGCIKVVVATIAFGMGINHPDVRFVIHHTMSRSLDGYYQEGGRAGRDGLPSECVILFRGSDVFRVTGMAVTEPEGLDHAYAMIRYAMSRAKCRRALIVEYFNTGYVPLPIKDLETVESECGSCDICKREGSITTTDFTEEALTILHVLQALAPTNAQDAFQRVTCNQLVVYLKAVTALPTPVLRLRDEGIVTLPFERRIKKEICEIIILRLLMENYIQEDFHFTMYSSISYLAISPLGRRVLSASNGFQVLLDIPDE